VIQQLRIDGLRCLEGLDLELGPGLHVFVGPNGAGKTSILEGVAILGSGRSFRSNLREALIATGKDRFSLFARTQLNGVEHRLGFERYATGWTARLDGQDVKQIAELVRLFPAWVIEPDSHELIAGGSERRRGLLDWLMFHVEPNFGRLSGAYQRALKQRNAALKHELKGAELQVWNDALAIHGEQIEASRALQRQAWFTHIQGSAEQLLPELGAVELSYKRGWPADQELGVALWDREKRDLGTGYTSVGPHRADWSISFAGAADKHHLSRGQQKNTCFAAVLGTLQRYTSVSGIRPVLCLDDLFSELDVDHQVRCLQLAEQVATQVLVTGVNKSAALDAWRGPKQMFHVEHGRVQLVDRQT
jgi:DNA replication and repair protein RecF